MTNSHKVRISQLLPDGEILDTEVDVIATSGDSALSSVFKWYDVPTFLENERDTLPALPENVISLAAYKDGRE